MAMPNIAHEFSSSTELFDAQAHVWNHILNFIKSMSLKCAIQLGIFDIIHKHNKPITLDELSNALSITQEKSGRLYRLIRILAHSNFFAIVKISDEELEGYWLTPASRLLLRDDPASMTPFALFMLEPIMMDPWHDVSQWFLSSDSPTTFEMKNKVPFWEYMGEDDRLNDLFNVAMFNDSQLVIRAILKDHKRVFEGLKSLVDVAGGTGAVAKTIANACPGIKCTVLDLPHVVDGVKGGLDNLTYVGGDMLESIPAADAVLLKWALDVCSDEECVKILKNSKKAIPSKENGGKVIIVDTVLGDKNNNGNNDQKSFETQMFFDLLSVVHISGRERTEKEWEKLFLDAGFSTYKITPALGLRSIIEVFP